GAGPDEIKGPIVSERRHYLFHRASLQLCSLRVGVAAWTTGEFRIHSVILVGDGIDRSIFLLRRSRGGKLVHNPFPEISRSHFKLSSLLRRQAGHEFFPTLTHTSGLLLRFSFPLGINFR